ncbi:TKL/DICTY4/DRK protein kinase [Salpingoeca rosetta]|uniref:TKL/DICTY4/DRK protein kinase n=1 Tax=Salpingoeca rosetta (strain ATCC 50818 / BSB-021) TaxID=946362 RepID=F2TVI5_SALR5|nr:TKL/DICTY4/DRK protein kinase [Salpingoeca rosetta]EGD72081.1 TKL/DICTY4/DRK protein kinase [Salpingoeca rosetta]|eukprot:XP_004998653.1 TKL/DICTY4/DRK protein kinase [Salpingoeca rosetta]
MLVPLPSRANPVYAADDEVELSPPMQFMGGVSAHASASAPLAGGGFDRHRSKREVVPSSTVSTPLTTTPNATAGGGDDGEGAGLLTWHRSSWVFVQSPGSRLSHTMVGLSPRKVNGTLDSAANGRALLFGGETARSPVNVVLNNEPFVPSNDLWLFNVHTASWHMLAPTGPRPPPRTAHVADLVVLNGLDHMFVFGGIIYERGNINYRFLSDLWLYNVSENAWDKLQLADGSPRPHPRSGMDGAMCGPTTLYIYGGTSTRGCTVDMEECPTDGADALIVKEDLWKLEFDAPGPLQWELISTPASPGLRSSHSMICMRDTLYLHGGVAAPIHFANRSASSSLAVVDDGFIWTLNTTQQPLNWIQSPVAYSFVVDDTFSKEQFVSSFAAVTVPFSENTFGVVGGQHLATTWRPFILVFDIDKSEWTIFPPTLTQLQSSFRVFCAATNVAGTVLFHGGHNILTVLSDLHHVIPENRLVYPVPQQEFPVERAYAAVTFARDQNLLIIQGGFNGQVPLTDLWTLDLTTKTWEHTFDRNPLGARFGHFVHAHGKHVFFGLGASLVGLYKDMFVFDLETKQWSDVTLNNPEHYLKEDLPRVSPMYASYSPTGGNTAPTTHMLFFGGLRLVGIDEGFLRQVHFMGDTWILDTSDVTAPTWSRVDVEPGQAQPIARNLGAMTPFQLPSGRLGIFLYGGFATPGIEAGTPIKVRDVLDVTEIMSDAWVFWADTNTWQELNARLPGARAAHSVTFISSHIFLYGGTSQKPHSGDILGVSTVISTEDTWVLRMDTLDDPNASIFQLDGADSDSGAGAGEQSRRRESHPSSPSSSSPSSSSSSSSSSSYVRQRRQQQRPLPESVGAAQSLDNWLLMPASLSIPRAHHFIFGVNNSLLAWGGRDSQGFHDTNVYDLRLACLPGFASATGDFADCQPCAVGRFQSLIGQTRCFGCPPDVTTASEGANNPVMCSVCRRGYCRHGSCHVSDRLLPVCDCSTGWSGDRCEFNLAASISLSVLSSLLGLVGFAYLIHRYRKRAGKFKTYAQLQEKLLGETKEELEELERAWEIFPDELQFIKRIDTASPGAFGQVWLAKFSDVMVAVKRLKHELEELDEEAHAEFISEIKFMRGLRHKNIVYFYGAGFMNNQPFLVAEHMARGALDTNLADSSIDLSWRRRLGFLLDTASGMNFLHSLNPPRIHRDLKSPNLLVNESWVVKVTDFGTGRLVEHLQADAAQSLELTDSMQPTMTSNVGTLLWCAPEVHAGKLYSLSADVYSFAIVMWECATRELPFNEIESPWDIREAVDGGHRPPLVDDAPAGFNDLMQRCWHQDPAERPTFATALVLLTAIYEAIRDDGSTGVAAAAPRSSSSSSSSVGRKPTSSGSEGVSSTHM